MPHKIEICEVSQRSKRPFRVKIDGKFLSDSTGQPRRFKTSKDAFTAADWATREEKVSGKYTGPRI